METFYFVFLNTSSRNGLWNFHFKESNYLRPKNNNEQKLVRSSACNLWNYWRHPLSLSLRSARQSANENDFIWSGQRSTRNSKCTCRNQNKKTINNCWLQKWKSGRKTTKIPNTRNFNWTIVNYNCTWLPQIELKKIVNDRMLQNGKRHTAAAAAANKISFRFPGLLPKKCSFNCVVNKKGVPSSTVCTLRTTCDTWTQRRSRAASRETSI